MGSQEDQSSFHLGYGNRTPLAEQMIYNEDLGIRNLVVKAFDMTKKDCHYDAHRLATNQSYWRLAVTGAAIKFYCFAYIRGILTGG